MTSPGQARDIDLVLITGAGASAPFGVDEPLAMMSQWSDALVHAISRLNPSYLGATGLEPGLGGEEFETRLGKFLRARIAFGQIGTLLEPSTGFQSSQSGWPIADGSISQWHVNTKHHLDQINDAISKTLYELFGEPNVDIERASHAYQELFQNIAVIPTGGRWVYATTNYDTIGERVIRQLGAMPDWGQPPRLDHNVEEPLNVSQLIDGLPRFVPVLHVHGRIGWFRRDDGRTYGSLGTHYDPGFGTPIVMLPDPQKDYGSDAVIQSIWTQLEQSLSRAKRVFVLGHSLHDAALVRALSTFVQPAQRIAVAALTKSSQPATLDLSGQDVANEVQRSLTGAIIIPMRFGDPIRDQTNRQLQNWASASL